MYLSDNTSNMSDKIRDPGFGEKYFRRTKRMINPDGSFNVTRKGAKHSVRDMFLYLINMPWTKFSLLLVLFFIIINSIFGLLYAEFCAEDLIGFEEDLPFAKFSNGFFFSVQTISSVGYGKLSPEGFLANTIASIESLVGLATYALLTGLLYGRFSRPKARILFSKYLIVSSYKNKEKSLQFRIANDRSTQLLDITAKAIVSFVDEDFNRKYYSLKLEPESIRFFPLSWTVVHPIDEDSPFYGKGEEFFKKTEGEVLILIRGYDDTFSQEVHARSSYLLENVIWGAKYVRMFETDADGEIILDLNKISDIESIELEKEKSYFY